MALYHRYRPQTFEEMCGNEEVIESLKSDLKKKDKPHVFLLSGPTGTGKTTLGRIIAKELKCDEKDFREVDSAHYRGIDVTKEIIRQSQYKPFRGSCVVWLLDEIHQLTKPAQSALLKSLEDTPNHVYFILATTDPQGLIPTIRSRCAHYNVAELDNRDMYKLLRRIVKAENQEIEREVLEQIIETSYGRPREAIQKLDQVLSVEPEMRMAIARKAADTEAKVLELCQSLVNKHSWSKVSSILKALDDEEIERIRHAVLRYCNKVLLGGKKNDHVAVIMDEFIEPFYNGGRPQLTWACYKIIES